MSVDLVRHFLNYYMNENRTLWDKYIVPLPDEQFIQPSEYSMGSIRNQVVHLINAERTWLSSLRGQDLPEWFDAEEFTDKQMIRDAWDIVEADMRDYVASLTDEIIESTLKRKSKELIIGRILLHLVNHSTDHRAQILRQLHDVGVETSAQDYIFYVYKNP